MSEHRDRLGRRKRTERVSTGKRVSPQKRDLLWFRRIREHGPLPTSYLLAFSRDTHRSLRRGKERLTDLFNEENTPHGEAYLSRPIQQFRTLDSRYNQLVYDLTPASERALLDAGFGSTRAVRSGPWLHSFMVACTTASVELGISGRDDLHYLSQSDLLKRADADLRYPVRITNRRTGREQKSDIVPDALFGIEYRSAQGSRYRCFLVEADRSTEPATSKNFNRKSWQRNLLQYDRYVGTGLYREHLRLKAPLLILVIVTAEKRLSQILRLLGEQDPSIRGQVLLQTWEDFQPAFSPPQPNRSLLEGYWSRAGLPGFRIDQV